MTTPMMAPPPIVAQVAAIGARLAADPRLADRVVARPHPLLVLVRQGGLFVVCGARPSSGSAAATRSAPSAGRSPRAMRS